MARKRYAILAAVSQHQQQHQHQQQQHPHNATVMSTASTTTTTTIDSTSLGDSEEELLRSHELGSSSSIIPYYNGGVGLYNQQRGIAGGSGGISLLNGAAGSGISHGAAGPGTGSGSQTYAHVVNGSVNLLLGG